MLWIDSEGVTPIKMKINDKDFILNENSGCKIKKSVDISSYVKIGTNDIIYYPPNPELEEGLSVKLWIELEKAR